MILYQMGVKMPEDTWPIKVQQAVARDRKLAAKSAG